MYNFWTIVAYEYKKLLKKKIVWIAMLILTGICVFAACANILGNYYVEGEKADTHWNIIQKSKQEAQKYEGREIDDTFLQELNEKMQTQLRNIPEDLYNFVFEITQDINFDLSAEELYMMRDEMITDAWESEGLSQGAKEYLTALEEEVDKPITYHNTKPYQQISSLAYVVGFIQIMMIAICIPAIFSEEHTRKTDQLILSSDLGKKTLYLAKIFTGLTISMITIVIFYLAIIIPSFLIYGTQGFHGQIQLVLPTVSWNLTVGEMVCILIGLGMTMSILVCAAAMFLAEKFRSSVAVIAILLGFVIFSMVFHVPEQYRILEYIWSYMPTSLSSVWEVFGTKLISVFGGYFTIWQSAPVFYLILTVILTVGGYFVYSRYQVGGR